MRLETFLALALPFGALAALNGHCDKSIATGQFKTRGICIKTSTCKKYKGKTQTGACPWDPDDVKCCVIDSCGPDPDTYLGPYTQCDWTSNGCPVGNWLKSR